MLLALFFVCALAQSSSSGATAADVGTTSNRCADQRSESACVAWGRRYGTPTTVANSTACVWCGVSATNGKWMVPPRIFFDLT